MTDIRVFSLFCEDVRVEHDNRCTLVGLIPSVGMISDEPIKMRQICLLFSADISSNINEVEASYEVTTEGDVCGLSDKFRSGRSVLRKPDDVEGAESWQVITFISSDNFEVKSPAKVFAKIRIGDTETSSEMKFYNMGDLKPSRKREKKKK